MTNEERDIISQFITRVGGAGQTSGFGSGAAPAAQQQALPPVDRDADSYIGQLFTQYPEARYRITQLAFVQERALVEAQNRIRRLEWEVQQAQQAAQATQQQPRSGGGLFGGLFGGGNRQQSAPPGGGPWNQGGPQQQYNQSAPPPPQYPPNYQQGMLPRQGSGFLGSALTTAAGVAGGMVVGNALMDLFSGGSHGTLGSLSGADMASLGGGTNITENNFFGDSGAQNASFADQAGFSDQNFGSDASFQDASFDDGGDFGGGGDDSSWT